MGHDPVDLREARHGPHAARERGGRRRAILRAALELAQEEGRDALSLARVADRAGLPRASLRREFPSQDALVAELQRSTLRALDRATDECVEAADRCRAKMALTARERSLLAVIVSALAFERFARDVPADLAILAMESAPSAAGEGETGDASEGATDPPAFAALAGRLRDAQRCGAIGQGDADERAVGLRAGLQGIAWTRRLSGPAAGRIDAARIAEGLISALLVGWGAETGTAARLIELARRERFADASSTTLDDLARGEGAGGR